MRLEWLCIAATALLWGGYPLVVRSTNVSGPVSALILTVTALLPIGAIAFSQGPLVRPVPADVVRLVIAGVMMGLGLVAFNVVASSRQLDASVSIPTIDTAMLIVSVIGAVLFFAEPITVKKVVGVALLVAGIVTLRPN